MSARLSTFATCRARVACASARDRALVAGILEGGKQHFEELYGSYFPRVYRFALKRLGDSAEAEDVTQEVFETIFKVLPSYRGDSSLLVWIFGITRNKVNRRFRGARPRIESIDEAHAESLASPMRWPTRSHPPIPLTCCAPLCDGMDCGYSKIRSRHTAGRAGDCA